MELVIVLVVSTIRNFCLVFAFLFSTTVYAQQAASFSGPYTWQVKIQEENSFDEEGLQFLKWSRSVYLVKRAGTRDYVQINGQFREPVKQAVLNGKPFPVNPDGSFELKIVVIEDKKVRFNIFATAASNDREHKMQYTIAAVHAKAKEISQSRWRLNAGAGATLISFRQRNVVTFDEWALTIKGGATYRLVPDQWDIGMSTFFNAFVFSTTSPANLKIQYLGFNLKAAYHVVSAPSSWRFIVSGGFYWNSSLSVVGFANMMGPQISPEVTYIFPNGSSLFWYSKFAYALSGEHDRFFKDNREVATGIHYSFPINHVNRLSFGVDLSQLSLSADNHWASTNTYSFSGGLSF